MRRDHEAYGYPRPRIRLFASILAFALGGCGAAHSSTSTTVTPSAVPTSPATAAGVNVVDSIAATAARDRKRLLASSYTPERYEVSQIEGGTRILVFHSVCTGSADGHCQAIQVFRGEDPSPVWVGHYAGVTSFHASLGGFSVTSVRYAASDPLCCPSLPPETRDYRWNGKTFTSARPGSRVSP
jgi:hypothetical protein